MTSDESQTPADAPEDLDPSDLDPGAAPAPVPGTQPSPVATDRQRAAQGGRWGVISGICEQGGSIVATLVLARLLGPEDIGVVAAATVLLNLLAIFGNVGFGASLIKRRSIEEPVSSTTFWASVLVGSTLTVALIVAAPLLARVLDQPSSTPYVRGLAPLLLITMVSQVSEARLLRALRFTWVYTADIANIAVYASITLTLAALGAGPWSMVIGRVLGELVATVVRLVAARWWPSWVFSWHAIRSDLRFTGGFLSLQFGTFFAKNVDYWVVSRLLGAAALGSYYVAFVLPTVLRQRMTWLSTEILLPLMAKARDDRPALVGLFRESLELVSFVAVPVLIGIALTAEQVIAMAFGSRWTEAVGPLRWLAVATAFEVSASVASTLFLAIGKPGVLGRIMFGRLVVLCAGLLVALQLSRSTDAVAATVAVSMIASTIAIHVALRAELAVSLRATATWVRPIWLAASAMVAGVVLVDLLVDPISAWVEGPLLAVVGAALYLGSVRLADRDLTQRTTSRLRTIARPS